MLLKKFLLLSVILTCILLNFVWAQSEYKVVDIVVKGNQKITSQEILRIADIKKNMMISDDQINKIKEKLENSTYFISVVVNKTSVRDGIVLEINVIESPFLIFINGIRFQGLEKVSVKDLQNLLILPYVGWSTDELIWEQRRKFMSTSYFSMVDVKEEKSDGGYIITFVFKENPILEKIDIIGLEKLKREDILNLLNIKEGILISEEDLIEKKSDLLVTNKFSKVDFDIVKKNNKLKLSIILKENPLISKITLSGNKKTDITDIKEILNLKGDIKENTLILQEDVYFYENLLSSWKEKLERSGYFKSINIDVKEENEIVTLSVNVVENPWIALINVQGLKNLSREKVIEVIGKTKKEFLSEYYLSEIKDKLLKTGYFSSVEIKYVISTNNYAYLTLILRENPILERIDFSGLKYISEDEVKKYLILKTGDFISEEKINDQVERFEGTGYFSEVKLYKTVNNDKITLIFEFKENPLITKIIFIGVTGVSDKELKGVLVNKEGFPFNPESLRKDIQNIQDLLQARGYVFTSIQNVTFNEKGELVFYFKEYRVEDIQVEIIPTTETSVLSFLAVLRRPTDKNVVRREISLSVGEPINWEKIKSDLQRIYNVGIFEDVSVRFEQGSSDDSVKIIYSAKEKLSGSFNFGGGYATDVGLYGFIEYKEGNLFGRAQQLLLQLSLTSLGKLNYQLSFKDPWFLGGKNFFSLDLYNKKVTVTDASTSTTSTVEKAGGAFSFSYPLENRWSISLGFKYENITPIDSVTFTKSTTIGSFNVGIGRDTRDFYLNPTQGSRQYIGLEFAGGGSEANFIKVNSDLQWHIPLTKRESTLSISQQKERQVLSFRLGFGLADGNIPSTELFTLGGASSIRGFSDNVFSGNSYILLNMQYRIPLGNNIYGVAFVDSGSAWNKQDITSLSDIKFYTGVGVGLRYDTLIIPIRFDFGYNFGNDPLDPNTKWRVHFSFGDIF